MADLCGLCEVAFEATSIKTQLLCGHTFHTECMIQEYTGLTCTLCDDAHSFHNHTVDSPASREQVLKFYDDSEPFRKALKNYVDATKACAKPRRALEDLAKLKKADVSVRYAQIRAELDALYETKKDEIITSEQYKSYKKAVTKQQAVYNQLRRNYARYTHMFHHLREKPGLKTLRSIWQTRYYRPTTFIRRAVHFRYRFRY